MSVLLPIPRLYHGCPGRSVEYQSVLTKEFEQVGRYGHAW